MQRLRLQLFKKISLLIIFICLFSFNVNASVNFDSGNFTANYIEPTINDDATGTPLQDLSYTTIYYSIDNSQKVKVMDIPALSVNGGGTINQPFTISGLDLSNSQLVITIIYTATDLSGNTSREFIEPPIRIDNVSPKPPTGL